MRVLKLATNLIKIFLIYQFLDPCLQKNFPVSFLFDRKVRTSRSLLEPVFQIFTSPSAEWHLRTDELNFPSRERG